MPSRGWECPDCHQGALASVQNRVSMRIDRNFPLRMAAFSLVAVLFSSAAQAEARLNCLVTYAGTSHQVVANPVADAYTAASVDIAGRFRFKPIMVGQGDQIERIVIYTHLDALPHPVLIHQAKYLPPYPRTAQPWPITGQHAVYAGPQERELQYSCTLEGLAP